jgi:hypothetical protein
MFTGGITYFEVFEFSAECHIIFAVFLVLKAIGLIDGSGPDGIVRRVFIVEKNLVSMERLHVAY